MALGFSMDAFLCNTVYHCLGNGRVCSISAKRLNPTDVGFGGMEKRSLEKEKENIEMCFVVYVMETKSF